MTILSFLNLLINGLRLILDCIKFKNEHKKQNPTPSKVKDSV